MVELQGTALDSVFHALSDGTRRAILRNLTEDGKSGEKTVGDVARPYKMSLAGVSKHLQVLERAKLVRMERNGNRKIVRLNAEKLRAAQDWLAYYERFWQGKLDALQNYLETAETPRERKASDGDDGDGGAANEFRRGQR